MPQPQARAAMPRPAWQPPPGQLLQRRRRQALTATTVAVLFALSGLTLIGVVIATQQRVPAPPGITVSAVDPTEGVTAPQPQPWRRVEAWKTQARPDGATSQPLPPDARAGAARAGAKPISIDIPAIDVHSVVRHLGQASNGSLEVPSGAEYDDAAWYRHSPTPGSLGPAVILGHVDSAARGPSVFFRLGELRRGNRVTITRADDSVAVFVVDAVHRYAKERFPTKAVYSDIDHAGLRILTCGGAFDDATGSYVDNIVVFASLVHARP